MGMLLFDKSGTFVPSDYGLSVGDVLHIVAIGGGGSVGAAGGATSFGNLLTVAGGAAAGSSSYGGEGGWHPALPVTLCAAPPDTLPVGTVLYSNAGGSCCSETLLSGGSSSLDTVTIKKPFATLFGGAGAYSFAKYRGTAIGQSIPGNYNGGGGTYAYSYAGSSDSSYTAEVIAGGGGSGYGAGGGGGYARSDRYDAPASKNGGAHGVFDWLDYTLSANSPTSFAITIGAGGAAGSMIGVASECYYNYGAGASGCVAIYW